MRQDYDIKTMMVVAPYVVVHPECREALGSRAEYVDVSGDDFAYWHLLDGLWRAGDPFIIVEHDILVRPDSIDELADCPEPWCAFRYLVDEVTTIAGFGCVKFDPGRVPYPLGPIPLRWWGIDGPTEYAVFLAGGPQKHIHGPPLEHLNPGVLLMVERARTFNVTHPDEEKQ